MSRLVSGFDAVKADAAAGDGAGRLKSAGPEQRLLREPEHKSFKALHC